MLIFNHYFKVNTFRIRYLYRNLRFLLKYQTTTVYLLWYPCVKLINNYKSIIININSTMFSLHLYIYILFIFTFFHYLFPFFALLCKHVNMFGWLINNIWFANLYIKWIINLYANCFRCSQWNRIRKNGKNSEKLLKAHILK